MTSKYKFLVSVSAKKDIDNTIDYIVNKLKNGQAATKLYNAINDKIDKICEDPMLSKDCRYYGIEDETVRRVKIKNYILFYKIETKQIIIIRFLYSKMDITTILNNHFN